MSRDDSCSVLEHALDLLESLNELAVCEDQVLAPIAERSPSVMGWTAVREEEDAVGWSLVPAPPPWPRG